MREKGMKVTRIPVDPSKGEGEGVGDRAGDREDPVLALSGEGSGVRDVKVMDHDGIVEIVRVGDAEVNGAKGDGV
jgi:hypothetical protein